MTSDKETPLPHVERSIYRGPPGISFTARTIFGAKREFILTGSGIIWRQAEAFDDMFGQVTVTSNPRQSFDFIMTYALSVEKERLVEILYFHKECGLRALNEYRISVGLPEYVPPKPKKKTAVIVEKPKRKKKAKRSIIKFTDDVIESEINEAIKLMKEIEDGQP